MASHLRELNRTELKPGPRHLPGIKGDRRSAATHLIEMIGGRGRNRTGNLSVKSPSVEPSAAVFSMT
jgi:hypothetical protein